MRLLIDLQGCQNGSRHRGIGRYSLSLAKALLRNAGPHEVMLLLNGLFADTLTPLRQEFEGLIEPSRILVFHVPGPVDELKPENAWRKHAAELLRETMIADLAPDALLVSSMVEGAMDDTVTSVGWLGGPTVVGAVLYDLIPLLDPERYIGWAPLRRWYFGKMDSFRRCDLLLAISASAKREAEQALGVDAERVVNISTAADDIFEDADVSRASIDACRDRLGIVRPYLMHSGNVEARKNFQGLIRAFGALGPALRSRYQLVLVGKFAAEARLELEALAKEVGLKPGDAILTGYIEDDELIALYAGCHLFVFPSLHEGFGLPALEAMHFGVPTIGSNTTSVPEVIGRADATFDPTSISEMAALITRCLTDRSFYDELRAHACRHARTFSWDECARRALAALEQQVDQRQAQARPSMPRTARELMIFGQLVAPPEMPPPGTQELLHAARCMARNEAELRHMAAHAVNGGQLTWRVEGPFDSSYSLALVNREAARALAMFGHRVVLHSTEGPGDFAASPTFLDANPDLAAMYARVADHPHNASDVVSRNLYPPRVADMAGRLNVLHHYAWEETGFPSEWVDHFNRHLGGITCTSEHVRRVLMDNGVTVPMAAIGNGVDHWERIEATPGLSFPGKRFRFLHVSSCFPRKGADVMLQAYGRAFTAADEVSLLIKTFRNPHNDIHQQIAACRVANPMYPDVHVLEDDIPDADLKALYLHCHVLVAPSRAEGFGLPLAEAMLSGLPVITTNWGGQLDFCCEENAWLVDYSFAPTQTHFRLHGSVWADPEQASLTTALRLARSASADERRARAAHGRDLLLANYSWSNVTARALQAVRAWSKPADQDMATPRVGWVTTWNTKCGIASYSRHIIEAADRDVAVLAPRQDGLLRDDEPFCLRCWTAGKRDNGLDDLARTIDARCLDVLLVQFNYGFFGFEALARFLDDQVDMGRTVMLTMHSTGDPPELAAGDRNWRLATLAPALARCHRLLVHTVADMNRLKALGLVDNVMLFPHPLWTLPVGSLATSDGRGPVLATFGYCLPHKGLPEVIEAVALLKRRGRHVRLRMLNAEYPDPVSTKLAAHLRARISELGVGDRVEFRSDFLSDAHAAAQLSASDLLVFAYQDTQESASGAVRHALATTRPMLVTPVPIFDELGDAVFRAAGRDANALADAIESVLQALQDSDAPATAVAAAAARWRKVHDVDVLARRLNAVMQALHSAQPARPTYAFAGSDRMLRTEVGLARAGRLISQGKAGHLLFGPYLALPPSRYVASLTWGATLPTDSTALLRVVARGAREVLAEMPLEDTGGMRWLVELPFIVEQSRSDVELHLTVSADVDAEVTAAAVKPA